MSDASVVIFPVGLGRSSAPKQAAVAPKAEASPVATGAKAEAPAVAKGTAKMEAPKGKADGCGGNRLKKTRIWTRAN